MVRHGMVRGKVEAAQPPRFGMSTPQNHLAPSICRRTEAWPSRINPKRQFQNITFNLSALRHFNNSEAACALNPPPQSTQGHKEQGTMKKLKTVVMAACLVAGLLTKAQNAPSVDSVKQKAEAGDAMAQAQYASMLQFGQGVEKNEVEALKWYQKAAEAGNAYAQANMGVFCQTGGGGMAKDISKAAEWFEKAANQGNTHAQFYLARLYENGNGVEKNINKAAELYGKAANGGMPIAQHIYAMMLSQGEGVDRNVDEALKWAEKAAAAGEGRASKLIPTLKKMKEMDDKTPKSLLGVEFGAKIETWKEHSNYNVQKSDDGMSSKIIAKPSRTFRRFSPVKSLYISGTITSHRVYKFYWPSEDFDGDSAQKDMKEEAVKTCEVIAKKFGGEFKQIDDAYVVTIGWLKVVIKTGFMDMNMTVTNTMLEDLAKKEYKALKDAEGDGSDAL